MPRPYDSPPVLDDVQFWQDHFSDLLEGLNQEQSFHDHAKLIAGKQCILDRVRFMQENIMKLFPKWDALCEKKPSELPADCDWWNGVCRFTIEGFQADGSVQLLLVSYVAGGNYDSRTLTLPLPKHLL